jgi:hypothetical protein
MEGTMAHDEIFPAGLGLILPSATTPRYWFFTALMKSASRP